ncbi:MAG: glycine cleavage system protein GcvH [Nitrososphaerales archaeon]|jgi:glycine cleavage system H protein
MTDHQYTFPADLVYTKEHEWARIEGSTARVGITDYAAKVLNDVVYLTLPSPGETVRQLKTFGTVESIKAVSELYSPLSGTVKGVNSELQTHPELVNKSPYGEGWIVEIEASDLEAEKAALLGPEKYAEFVASLGK